MPIIWLLGGPRSGRTTQLKNIFTRYHILTIEPLELLSNEVSDDTELGKEITKLMLQDILVPRVIIAELIKREICANMHITRGFILKNFPKDIEMARDFDHLVCVI
jgi:adenylate kinase